jgi:hypothetical protein
VVRLLGFLARGSGALAEAFCVFLRLVCTEPDA